MMKIYEAENVCQTEDDACRFTDFKGEYNGQIDYGKVNTYRRRVEPCYRKNISHILMVSKQLLTEHLIISSDFFRHKNTLLHIPYRADISRIQPSLSIYTFV
jgi:hypothetical protein